MLNNNFKDLVSQCVQSKSLIGSGNPNAKILFVGKEGSNQEDGKDQNIKNNLEFWKEQIKKNEAPTFNYSIKDFTEGHTWSKYQKLHDYIFENTQKHSQIFENNVFTTEMSEAPFKQTSEAQKKEGFAESLKNRKQTFFTSDFIKNFNVVVLACSNYIQNVGKDGVWEINSIFGVKWEYKHIVQYNGNEYRFDTHFNEDKSKLVIHCYQLSGAIPDKYLQSIAAVIREFIK
jgi:hypothetical protein